MSYAYECPCHAKSRSLDEEAQGHFGSYRLSHYEYHILDLYTEGKDILYVQYIHVVSGPNASIENSIDQSLYSIKCIECVNVLPQPWTKVDRCPMLFSTSSRRSFSYPLLKNGHVLGQ